MDRHRGDDPRPHLKRGLVLAAALAAAVALGLGLYADFGKLWDELGSFRWELFPAAVALTSVNYAFRFVRWELYLRRLGIALPLGRSVSIFVAGLSMTISPAKLGEVLKSGLLRRSFDVPVRRSAPVVLAERVTDATGVVVLALVGGAGALESWPLLVVALAGAVAIALAVRTPLLDRWALVGEARSAAVDLLGWRLLTAITLLSAVSWFFECLAAYVCVRGLDLDVSLGETVAVFSIGSLAGALSLLPGGLGVAETSMTALFRALDVPKAGAAAATVLIRLATLWFAVAVGVIGLAVEERLSRRRS